MMAVSDRVQLSPELRPLMLPVAGGVKLTVRVPELLQTARTLMLGWLLILLGAVSPV